MSTEPSGPAVGSDERRSRWVYAAMAALPLIPLIVGLLVVLGAGDDDDQGSGDARALWEAEGPNAYEMVLEVRGMAGLAATTVTVAGGRVVDVRANEDSAFTVEPRTVDDLFDELDRARSEGAVESVEWHPELGYPVYAIIDPDPGAVDDEWTLRVVSLEAVDL